MKITILAAGGGHGDVRPILALGKGLKQHGHSVRLLARADLMAWIEAMGLEAVPAAQDILSGMEEGEGLRQAGPRSYSKQVLALKPFVERCGLSLMGEAWQACQEADAVISSPWSDVYAASIAEKRRIKHVSALLQPAWVATSSGPAALGAPLPGRVSILNDLAGKRQLEPLRWNLMGAENNRFRQETLHLPPQTYRQSWQALQRMLVVQGFSAHVVPHPQDWPPNIHTTGYWFLDEDPAWQPAPELLDFLAAGDPPVLMALPGPLWSDPAEFIQLTRAALDLTGQRAILLAGEAGRQAWPPSRRTFVLDSAPSAWLFPCLRVAVHPGDAGTTAECLRAGLPSVVVPHWAGQAFWGGRVADLGVGPPPLPLAELTAGDLAAAIDAAGSDPGIRKCAALLGAKIRSEDGVGAALDLIEAHLNAGG